MYTENTNMRLAKENRENSYFLTQYKISLNLCYSKDNEDVPKLLLCFCASIFHIDSVMEL